MGDEEVKWWMVRRERISVNWNLAGHVRCMVSHLVSVIVLEGVWRVWMFVRWVCVWACMCVCLCVSVCVWGGMFTHHRINYLAKWF